MSYRELGEGWEVAYWPPEFPDAGISLDALGRPAAARDAALLAELQAQVDLGPDRSLDERATLVRCRPLPFYDRPDRRHVLHELFRLGAKPIERARLVRAVGPDGATLEWIPLAWTSAPIHDLNEAVGGGPLAGGDAALATAFTDFFAGSIEGEAGTFQVVRFTGAELVPGEDGSPLFAIRADVLYAGTLFHSTFRVRRDGAIVMVDDEPFEDAALPLELRWLDGTRRVQPTIRVHVEIAAEAFLKCMSAARPEFELLEELTRAVDSPDTLAKWVRRPQHPLNVRGNVDAAAGTRFTHNWALAGPIFSGRRVVLEGSLTLARCHLEQGLTLARWTLRQGCRLDHAQILGDLWFDDVRMDNLSSAFGSSGEPPLNLRAAQVSGDVRFDRTRVDGEARLRYARILGQLELHGLAVTGTLDAAGIEASAILVWAAAADTPTTIGGDLVLSGARIRGRLDLIGLQVKGDFNSESMEASSILAQSADPGTRTTIGGNLNLSAVHIPGHVQFEPLDVRGDVKVLTPVEIGTLYLRHATDEKGQPVQNEPVASSIGGEIVLGNVAATGRIDLVLASCGAGVELRNVSCSALTVRGSVGPGLVAGGLESRGDVLLEDLAVDGASARATPLSLRHARIIGDLRIVARATRPAGVPGPVALSGAHVQGELALVNLHIAGNLDLSDLVAKRKICFDGVEVRDNLVMRHLSCQGDASLEGATVGGDVELHHAVVNGTLGLCVDDDSGGEARAGIGGKLLANALTAGKLVMTGDSWPAAAVPGQRAAAPANTGYLAWPALVGLVLIGLPVAAFAVLSALLGGTALAGAMLGGVEHDGDWVSLWIGLKWLFWTAVAAVVLFRIGRMWSALNQLRTAPSARSILTAAADARGESRLGVELLRLWGAAMVRALLLVTLAGTVFVSRLWPAVATAGGTGAVPDAPALPWVALTLAIAWIALLNVRVCGATGYWLTQLDHPAGSVARGVMATLFALDVAAYVFAIAWLALGGALSGPVRFGAALTVTALLAAVVRLWSSRPEPSSLGMGFLDAASGGAGGGPADRMRLDAAQVALTFRDWLQVATMNRLRPAVVKPRVAKCSLERARVGHLKIVHPVPDYVDIGNLVVDRWELPRDDDDTRSYQYLNLLSHAAEFSTDSFTALERSLRNAGDRESAEELHRSMRRETQWREQRWAQTASMLVLSLSGFGTRRARLIGLMTLWLLSTAFWFAADYDRAVGIGLAQRSEFMEVADDECMPVAGAPLVADGAGPARASPPSCEISARAALFDAVLAAPDAPLDRLGHGLAMAIRYHVPILAWDIRPFIFPRGAGMWVYVTIVEAIHWVLWPILIASLVPAILPRKDD